MDGPMKKGSGPNGNESACQFGKWGPRPLSVSPKFFQPTHLYATTEQEKKLKALNDVTPYSFVGGGSGVHGAVDANAEVVLQPGETGVLGPISFSPKRTGKSYSVVYVRNNVTGLETVILQGEGAQASVLMVDIRAGLSAGQDGDAFYHVSRGHWDEARVSRVTKQSAKEERAENGLLSKPPSSSSSSTSSSNTGPMLPSVRLPSILQSGSNVVNTNGTYVLLGRTKKGG